jgi:uncharacterized protein
MKYTISLTQECNLACSYCYIAKHPVRMTPATALDIIEQIFAFTPAGEVIDIGFFGGEPLLQFGLLKEIVTRIRNHPRSPAHPLVFSITTNGTIFDREIAEFLAENEVIFCLSCDGPAAVHDRHRRFADGRGSFAAVEKNLRLAQQLLPRVWVNAVYRPETLPQLADVVRYFSGLKVERIYLNPDYAASWTESDSQALAPIYAAIAEQYIETLSTGEGQYISLIDSKLAAIIKDGYAPHERCRMGQQEFAFSASGHIYPCERLIGAGGDNPHCIGHISSGLAKVRPCSATASRNNANSECVDCPLVRYCMNWCGCSNFFSTGRYDYAGPFMCASEKAAIETALQVFQTLEACFGAKVFEKIITVADPDRTRPVAAM